MLLIINFNRETVLHLAVRKKKQAILRALLQKKGIDITIKDKISFNFFYRISNSILMVFC